MLKEKKLKIHVSFADVFFDARKGKRLVTKCKKDRIV